MTKIPSPFFPPFIVKAMVFPVVMYGCESWTVKKAECRRIYAFFVLFCFFFFFFILFYFKFYFIFKLNITVLDLPNIKMNPPQEFMLFELWCWRRLLRVPWTARISNQSILKEISPGISLEGMMLKLKLQYFSHLT